MNTSQELEFEMSESGGGSKLQCTVKGVQFEYQWMEVATENAGYINKTIVLSSSTGNYKTAPYSSNAVLIEVVDTKSSPGVCNYSSDAKENNDAGELKKLLPASSFKDFSNVAEKTPLSAKIRSIVEVNDAGQLVEIFPCPFCPKTFNTKSMLTRHISVHQGNFVCSCGVRYKNQTTLTKHRIEVHGLTSPRDVLLKGSKSSKTVDKKPVIETETTTRRRPRKAKHVVKAEVGDPEWFF